MKRREFIAATAALLVSPRRSRAQGTRRRLGFLAMGDEVPTVQNALLDGLRNHGWIDGRNLIIEYRYAQPPGSPASFGCGAGRSQPRSAHRHQPTSSRSPEIGNRHHSDCIRGCGRSRGARPRPKPIASRRQHNGSCDFRAGSSPAKDRNTAGNGSYRLENCDLGQSGQSNSQADNSRGAAPNGPETRRGSADSRGDHGRGTGHRLCLGRSPARRCNSCFWRSFDLSLRHASYRARGEASSARDLSLPTYSSPMAD